ncbi:hypothetical protein [Calycomorphotria hydatis]|uniref:Uncharacterized protein n=1 Tax=Calycomorphotria hydatis TaxID=2528027 RepID=A0A517T5V3_9PLAN|nr:hypothetical protein [Calycomorphotria hydatis]QDT63766.1 hypothetical protein V22_09910 [Calycomorphotria hydatis]
MLNSSCRLPFLFCCFAALLACSFVGERTDAAERPKLVSQLPFDADAPVVKLFDGMESGQLEVKVISKDANSGNMFIENTTDGPLTIEMPEAFVNQQVMKQFGGGGLGGGGLGGGGLGGGQQGGGNQATGGGGGGLGGGLGGGGLGGAGGGAGGGFFSIPAETVGRYPFKSVCLEYGKPEPHARLTYRPVPVEEYSTNPLLEELLIAVGTNRLPTEAAQAAAWHLTNNMSWQQLASLTIPQLGGLGPKPYFTRSDLVMAQQIVARVRSRAAEKAEQRENPETPRTRTAN